MFLKCRKKKNNQSVNQVEKDNVSNYSLTINALMLNVPTFV